MCRLGETRYEGVAGFGESWIGYGRLVGEEERRLGLKKERKK